MRKVSKSVKVHLEGAIDNALNVEGKKGRGQGWALVAMVFFAVAREGLESVFFFIGCFSAGCRYWRTRRRNIGFELRYFGWYGYLLGGR